LLWSKDDGAARGALPTGVKAADAEEAAAPERSETAYDEVTGFVITVVDAI
jgi:hypothetical protein